jgi:hypothetical protein
VKKLKPKKRPEWPITERPDPQTSAELAEQFNEQIDVGGPLE